MKKMKKLKSKQITFPSTLILVSIALLHTEKFSVAFTRHSITKRESNCTGFESFSCKSGQCISRSFVCDGESHCDDGSDESSGCCTLPSPTADIKFTVICPQDIKCNSRPGETVGKFTELSLECNSGSKGEREDKQISICSSTGWLPALPSCKKLCEPLKTDYMELLCNKDKTDVKCSNFLYAGAIVRPQCKFMYHPKEQVAYREVTCQADGKWNHDLFSCVADCGILHGKPKKLISSGQREKYGDSPWHVGIYDVKGKDKNLICGGTIVGSSLIITAAHCLYDQSTQQVGDSGDYEVAVSKMTRDYDKKDNAQTKIYKVRGIFVHDDFYGSSTNYLADIAALWLKEPLTISSVVLPACLHRSDHYPFNPGENFNGKIVGWGETGDKKPSENLLAVNLPFISHSRCLSMLPESSKSDVTNDKFCAGNRTGPTVEPGDNGGGLVFRDQSSGLYYLRGVTSALIANNTSSLRQFTDVTQYSNWIQEIENLIEKEEKKIEADSERECDTPLSNVKKNAGFKCSVRRDL